MLVACGTPGAPQPPSLELPRPVEDLFAKRKGDVVTLTWTPPRQTTDGTRIRHMGVTRICRGINLVAMDQCLEVIGELRPDQLPASTAAVFTDRLPQRLQQSQMTGFAAYAVETQNDRGRSAGLSNQVRVPLAPTLPPPLDLKAAVTPEGVLLTWSGELHEHDPENRLRHAYRVSRRASGTVAESVIGQVQVKDARAAELLDRNVEWESRYEYKVTPVTIVGDGPNPPQVEGEDRPWLEVYVHDSFPPAAPTGVEAVFSGLEQQKFIDLTWAPNTEADLAGYNVYRREAGAPAVKINTELVKTPAFRDSGVAAGRRYFYSVSAVDLRGNESGRSPEASEQVP
jgi:hypothetical protein